MRVSHQHPARGRIALALLYVLMPLFVLWAAFLIGLALWLAFPMLGAAWKAAGGFLFSDSGPL